MSPPNNTVPERVLSDSKHAVEMGYTQSKFVVENILNKVQLDHQLNTNVLRVGQISGPISDEAGIWNANEWFPAIMKTSRNMGLIPETCKCMAQRPVVDRLDSRAETFSCE